MFMRKVVLPSLTEINTDEVEDTDKLLDRFTQKMAPKDDYAWQNDSDDEGTGSIWWPADGAEFEIYEDIICNLT